jgi:hypothetical protein
LAFWRFGVLAFWRFGVLAFWRFGVLAFWRLFWGHFQKINTINLFVACLRFLWTTLLNLKGSIGETRAQLIYAKSRDAVHLAPKSRKPPR